MFYRAGLAAVAIFWAAMWTLLIRSELHPQESAWRVVPLELVLRQVFEQGQLSDLALMGEGTRLGHVRVEPKVEQATGRHLLEVTGNSRLPTGAAEEALRTFWEATVEFDAAGAVTAAHGTVSMRPPGPRAAEASRLEVSLSPLAGMGEYRLELAGEPEATQRFSLDRAGVETVLKRWGVDRQMVMGFMSGKEGAAPEVKARQAQLTLRGMQVETYEITARLQGQTLLTLHVSQLGQILEAKTLLGWELQAE